MNKANVKLMGIVTMVMWMMSISANAAELAPVANQNSPDAIPNQFVMMFEDAESMMEAVQYARVNDSTILHTYPSINGFAAELTADTVSTLRSHDKLMQIEANMRLHVSDMTSTDPTSLSWGVDRIDGVLDESYTHSNDGEGVNVYVLDSGIDDSHSSLAGRVVYAFDNMEDGLTSCGDHGTGVASIIGGETGVASGVTLHSVRVLDCNIVRGHAEVLAGLLWIGENVAFPAVVNVSVAVYSNPIYNHTVETLIAQGIVVVAAAGNDYRHDACDVSPASANGVITVGATDVNDAMAWFNSQNDGNCINTYAPGVDIVVPNDSGEMISMNGTSLAAPHVTGCVARYLEYAPTATPADVVTAIETASSSGVLDCSFVDAMATDETSLSLEGEIGIVPLAVNVNHVVVYENGIMALVALFVSAVIITTAVYGWERR